MAKSRCKIVEAEGFVLKDSNGRERGRLDVENGEPALTLLDAMQTVRLRLAVFDDGPSVALYGADGEIRSLLKIGPAGPNFSLFRHEGEVEYTHLTQSRDGKTIREDISLRPQLELFVESEGPGLALYGLEEKSRILLTAEDHGAALQLDAPRKKSRVEMHADVNGANVLLTGADGKTVRSIG